MNILTSTLPTSVLVDGVEWPINTSFAVGVEFEKLIYNSAFVEKTDKIIRALTMYYPHIPPNISGAVDAMLWFYRCGEEPQAKETDNHLHKIKRAYDFDQDATLIYTAFYGQYGIDLNTAKLHWWTFRALFRGLSADCEIVKIMGYRTADTKGMTKEQKKHYDKMRQLYAIKSQSAKMSLEDRNKQMLEHAAKCIARAGDNNTDQN